MSSEKMVPAVAATGVPQKVSVVNALATKLECDPAKLMPLLKKTAFSTCRTDEEFMAMCMVANTYNLNPILKEVYAFPSKGGAVVPIVGVDGWIKLMNANPNFDGIDFEEGDGYCTAKVYRKDRTHPISATEWLDECKRETEPWLRWPRRMLRHKAMIQAARIAFGFAGIYDEDEAQRIASVTDAPKPEIVEDAPKTGKEALRARLKAKGTNTQAEATDAPQAAQTPETAKPDAKADLEKRKEQGMLEIDELI